ncbi:MAG: FG-GAP repeat protein [Myxococcota bacterium]
MNDRNRNLAPLALAALVAALAASGCDSSMYDFRAFDDLADTTWVDSSSAPGDLGASFYGVGLAAGGADVDGGGAAFYVAGRRDDGFARLRFDANGNRSDDGIIRLGEIVNDPPLQALPAAPVMVGDPASERVAVALTAGMGEEPTQSLFALLDGTGVTPIAVANTQPITGLAFGQTNLTLGTTNLVAISGDLLTVVNDITNPTADEPRCQLDQPISSSLALGDLNGGEAGLEIIVATRADGQPGRVVALLGSVVGDANMLACFDTPSGREPLVTLEAPGGESDFGRQIAVGNFDGGSSDLVVTAPTGSAVYIYLNLDVTNPGTPITISAPEGAVDFGATLALGDLDGDGRDELVVGAPGSTADGVVSAGSVFVYPIGDGGTVDEPIRFYDSQPEDNQLFGQSVAMVPFAGGSDILVVGADNEVFTYFRTPLSDDVRSQTTDAE